MTRDRGQVVTFYSYKGGTGRTMALANVAWLLACSGRRVLAVDWDLEAPGLQRYFHPFLRDKRLRSATGVLDMIRDFAVRAMAPAVEAEQPALGEPGWALSYAESLRWSFPGDGMLDFLPAGRQDAAYSDAMSTFDWVNFWDRLGGGAFFQALRADLVEHYDYVLIDSRTGMSDTAGICTVVLPDTLVDCFTLNTQSIDGAAAIAADVLAQRGDRPIRILPLPMRVEVGDQERLRSARNFASWRFKAVFADRTPEDVERYWQELQVPNEPFFAYEEVLAVFAPDTAQADPLLGPFLRLCAEITAGDVAPGPADVASLRQHRPDLFLRPAVCDVLICYAPDDLLWAEWVRAQLTEVGVDAGLHQVRLPGDHERLADGFLQRLGDDLAEIFATVGCAAVVLIHTRASAGLTAGLQRAAGERAVPRGPVIVRVDATPPAPAVAPGDVIDLAGLTDEQARTGLVRLVDPAAARRLPDAPPAASSRRPRPATAGPHLSNLGRRNPHFVGRQALLEALRMRLHGDDAEARCQMLYGPGGVGKTELALEYAHRFGTDYDLVWWVAAEHPVMVRTALGALATRLHLATGGDLGESVAAVRAALRDGAPHRRWLLVLDDVGEPDAVLPLVPTGSGHVVWTCRSPVARPGSYGVEVVPFSREESMAFLNELVPGVPAGQRRQVAGECADLPRSLVEAAAWLGASG